MSKSTSKKKNEANSKPVICLIAGHGGADPGAVNQKLRLHESDLAISLRNLVGRRLANYGATVQKDPSHATLNKVIDWAQNLHTKPDILLSLHFNAASPEVSGTECLHVNKAWDSTKALASKLSKAVSEQLGNNDRGAKPESYTRHGRLGILHAQPEAKSLMLEVEFLSNNSAIDQYLGNREAVGNTIADVLAEELGLCTPASKEQKIEKQA